MSGHVERIYDSDPVREWQRLEYRRTEFGVTCLALDEFLPAPPARVLDAGAGPGRYAIHLAQRGYAVSVLDISAASLGFASRAAAAAGVAFEQAIHGSAVDLAHFADSFFDATLLMGPLYHLKEERDRIAAISEAVRVTRPGGTIFSVFLNRYSVFRHMAKNRPSQLWQDRQLLESVLEVGHGASNHPDSEFLSTCYFADPGDVAGFMETCGVSTRAIIGCEGVVVEAEERLLELPPDQMDQWNRLNYRLGKIPALHALSAHVLHVGMPHGGGQRRAQGKT